MIRPPQSSGVVLRPTPKNYYLEQDKIRPPAETVAWVKERFALLGDDVLKKTLRIDTGRLDIPVYISLCGPAALNLTKNAKQMGKGASAVQAEASALMELAERFSFFHFFNHTEFTLARAAEIAEPKMPSRLAAEALYHPNETISQAVDAFEMLPQTWAWARNLTLDREEMIPLGWFYAINEYNGPAAGNCLEEAILQGMCEVVERHVSALVTENRLKTPAIDQSTISDPLAGELLQKFKDAGIKVWLKDFSCGMGIPSVGALCYDPSTFPHKSEIVYTAGTATSPVKALIRALTEVAQLAGDFDKKTSYEVSALPKFTGLEEAQYVMEADRTVSLASLPDISSGDLAEEVKACTASLADSGFPVYSLKMNHPVLDVPVVYNIIPKAHFAKRTVDTNAVFHAAKLASQLFPLDLAEGVLRGLGNLNGAGYYVPFFRAIVLIRRGEPLPALDCLKRALVFNPPDEDKPSIYVQMAVALKDMGQYDKALSALYKAASYPDPHQEVFNLMGFCHFKLNEYEKAIEAFSLAVESDPAVAINYANIGVNLRRLGEDQKALVMFRHALDLDPELDFAQTHYHELTQANF